MTQPDYQVVVDAARANLYRSAGHAFAAAVAQGLLDQRLQHELRDRPRTKRDRLNA